MPVPTLDDLREPLTGRRVFLRADLNVPLEDCRVTDATRIDATLPTLRRLLDAGAAVVVASHLGRPRGEPDPALSLEPVADALGRALGRPVRFAGAADPAGLIAALGPGDVLVRENLRFDPREEADDPGLGEELMEGMDVYVNDAFGAAHRAHASTHAAPLAARASGRPAVAGDLMVTELRYLGSALDAPERPFLAILGGAKISGKIDVMRALLERVDGLLVGGAMANTFFRALGLETGDSLVEEERVDVARELLEDSGTRLTLPLDCVVLRAGAEAPERVARSDVPAGARILDIGSRSVGVFARAIAASRTIVWNGPMGWFERPPFDAGTTAIARALAEAADRGATAIVGGGDTAAAVAAAGLTARMTHVSTGGGASLEFLEREPLPGVVALAGPDDPLEAHA
ncbi:MAG TPA: phosphoglycerate kinase [Longimicrobiales bacterium]|nr:phosphoglycerate kinase [Longimicrobiales bacterium]